MSNYPSIDRLAELQQLIADFAKVERVPHLADNGRPENDVEHSFGLALTCWYLQPKIAPELDLLKILQYALAHDIVELHAGDTYVFDLEKAASKEERERAALEQISKDWHDFPELVEHAKDYMDKANEEAKFVKAVDKLLPVIMIDIGQKQVWWHKYNVTLEMEREHKKSIRVSDYVSPYYEQLIEWLDKNGNIPKS
ncbi:Metal dependent phosphohydrolase [Candidatus Saccharibacteria bacterium RAAC3_TM7_1]|nr:Metal dependent phosphohydrolase [Candidatus Saccharibacteria bacterium RAAC3_TM7_1]